MKPRSSRFSPRLLEPELLEQLTVGREPALERLVTNMSAAIAAGHGRYDLLVGPRGVGKSHMFALVEGRLRAHPRLRERLVVVSLPEEFSPSSLLHLLARVLEGLPGDPELPPVATQLEVLRRQDPSEATDTAVAMIRARLHGRSLLVMLENLDVVFRDLGRKAQARLRKIVQTERGWSIFATARSAIDLAKQSEPFHGTFVVEQLEALTQIQCREMMLGLARLHERPELETWLQSDAALTHLRAAHNLVGGNPRVVAMLFHHLDPAQPDDLEGNFYRLADEVTPYFQEQMTRLSAGQRPVMELLAERWTPASVKEIAAATFNEATTVSTHLRALRRDRLVQAIAVGKERFYEVSNPLHRIARAMKHDRALGAAIAQMARVWASFDGLGRLCEPESDPFQWPSFADLVKSQSDQNTAIGEAAHLLVSGLPPRPCMLALSRLAREVGVDIVANVLDQFSFEIPDLALVGFAQSVWLRQELEQLLASRFVKRSLVAVARSPQTAQDTKTALRVLEMCRALEGALRAPADPDPEALRDALRSSGVIVPLWIASGRDLPALRRALETHADDAQLGHPFEHALAAENSARAFACLGAESRAFTREILQALDADDLLTRFPSEPSEQVS